MNIEQLLYSPKTFVRSCEYNLRLLGKTESYDYNRFINEELNELIDNHNLGKHENNIQLLIDDIVDSMWVILPKLDNVTIPISEYVLYVDTGKYIDFILTELKEYNLLGDQHSLGNIFTKLILLAKNNNIDWHQAFLALIVENMSKLQFPEEMRSEVFRDGKLNKKSVDGELYPWYTPADFTDESMLNN